MQFDACLHNIVKMLEAFVKTHPARFSNYVNFPEKVQEYVNETKYNVNTLNEYHTFIRRYLLEDIPLAHIQIDGVSSNALSAWAADELGTYLNWEKKFNTSQIEENVATVELYKKAYEQNADIYSFDSGYIYHVQEYMRTKSLGLPTRGIRVTTLEGRYVGFVPEPDMYK